MIEPVKELENTCIGKKCIIIGGGHSVNEIDWHNVYCDTIAVNYLFLDMKPTYYINTDKEVAEWYDIVSIEAPVISYMGNTCLATTHRWTYQDFAPGTHTPYYALCFAVMAGYDEIYLSGLDYCGDTDAIHYYDKSGSWCKYGNHFLLEKYIEWKKTLETKRTGYFDSQRERYSKRMFAQSTDKLACLRDFEFITREKIYNASSISMLKKYPYRMPY